MFVNRRGALKTIGFVAPCLGLNYIIESNASAEPRRRDLNEVAKAPSVGVGATGKIMCIGASGRRHPVALSKGNVDAVLTEFDLATTNVRQVLIPMSHAHAVLDAHSFGYICTSFDGDSFVMIDAGLGKQTLYRAPVGYKYAGHGVILDQKKVCLLALKKEKAISEKDFGILQAIDLATGKVLSEIASEGVGPHDMALMPDGKIAVSHYGDLDRYDSPEKSIPRLTIVDSISFKVQNVIDSPRFGSLTHISISKDGLLCGLPVRVLPWESGSYNYIKSALGNRDFDVSLAEENEKKLGMPGPILTLAPNETAFRSHIGEDIKQRRPQSIAYDQDSHAFFITFPYASTVARFDIASNTFMYRGAFELGLTTPRGVASIGPSLVAISDQEQGLVLLDGRTMSVKARYRISLYDATHISHVPR